MSTWTLIWIALAAIVVITEAVAIYRGTKATLSWQVWELRALWWGRLLLVPLWVWATHHLFIPQEGIFQGATDDWIIVGAAVILTLFFLRYERLEFGTTNKPTNR